MFDSLPNEIILQIFSFLELAELLRIFSPLNFRFRNLLFNSNTPLYARLLSKTTLPLDEFIFRISQLSLIDWTPNDILLLFQHSKLARLKSIHIESSDNNYFGMPTNYLIREILCLPKLSKCKIKLSSTLYILNIGLSTSLSIQRMDLSMITLDMLLDLLSNLPRLRSLYVWLNSNGRKFDCKSYKQYYCLNLKRLNIGLHNDITFEEIIFLLQHMPVLHSLEIYGSVWDREFLNETRWRSILLGENPFPLLNKIKINLYVRYTINVQNVKSILSQFNKETFHRTNFIVTHDNMFWFYLTCFWKT